MLLLVVFSAGLITAGGVAPALSPALERAALQSTAASERRLTSRVVVSVPADDAELVVNDTAIPGAGASRAFETGPLDAGTHRYTFTVTWEPNTYTTITRS